MVSDHSVMTRTESVYLAEVLPAAIAVVIIAGAVIQRRRQSGGHSLVVSSNDQDNYLNKKTSDLDRKCLWETQHAHALL